MRIWAFNRFAFLTGCNLSDLYLYLLTCIGPKGPIYRYNRYRWVQAVKYTGF